MAYQPKRKTPTGPALIAYSVKEGKETSHWTKIGAYFPHEDGEGGNLVLDALPIGDRIVLRVPKAEA